MPVDLAAIDQVLNAVVVADAGDSGVGQAAVRRVRSPALRKARLVSQSSAAAMTRSARRKLCYASLLMPAMASASPMVLRRT